MKIKKPDLRHGSTLLWIGGVIAALLLTLGVNGTLSSWTTAIITNSSNSVVTSTAVILQETQGANTCISSSSTTNSSTCSTINKYGGITTPLTPGGTATPVDVTFTNLGSAPASSFVLAPAACVQSPLAGVGTPPAGNLCNSANTPPDFTVAVSCSPGLTYSAVGAWTDLVFPAGTPAAFASSTYTHTAGLAVNASATCRFTVALATGAGPVDQGITVTQPMTWTLNK